MSLHRVSVLAITIFICLSISISIYAIEMENADDDLFFEYKGGDEVPGYDEGSAENDNDNVKGKGQKRAEQPDHPYEFQDDASEEVGEFMRCIFASDVDCVLDYLEDEDVSSLRVKEIRAVADTRGGTALHYAAIGTEPEITKALLEAGCEANRRDKIGATPLHWAALIGNTPHIDHLLRHGADPQLFNEDGLYPIHLAASRGHVDSLVHLVHSPNKTPVDVLDGMGWTPLMHAANNSQLRIVNALLDLGADATLRDQNNMSPLHIAIFGGNPLIVRKLLTIKKVHPELVANEQANITPLTMAASVDSKSIVKELVDAGADINAVDIRGYHAIHYAARFDAANGVKALIDSGVSIEKRDPEGLTPLMTASKFASHKVVKMLVETLKAPLETKDNQGSTALLWAADAGKTNSTKVVKILLKAGADIWSYNTVGYNAMAYARRSDTTEEFEIKKQIELQLIDAGSYVTNAADKSLETLVSEAPEPSTNPKQEL